MHMHKEQAHVVCNFARNGHDIVHTNLGILDIVIKGRCRVEDTIAAGNSIIEGAFFQQACFKQVQPVLGSIQGLQVQCFLGVSRKKGPSVQLAPHMHVLLKIKHSNIKFMLILKSNNIKDLL